MFNIGDKVFYPLHGAGIIETIEEKDILGVKQKYYILRIVIDDIKIMVPIENSDMLGIRYVISKDELNDVLNILSSEFTHMDKRWNQRYRVNESKIRSGNINEIAEVVKNLTKIDRLKKLSSGEGKIYNNAKSILIGEIMLAMDISMEESERIIEDCIK